MRTLIMGGGRYAPDDTNTAYQPLWGNCTPWYTDKTHMQQVIPCDGKLSDLYVRGSPPGLGKSLTYSLDLNGVATALSVLMEDLVGVGEDVTDEIAVSAGDLVCMRGAPLGTPNVTTANWCLVFTATATGKSLILGTSVIGPQGELKNNGTEYAQCATGGANLIFGSEGQPVPTDGKFSGLSVDLAAAPDPGDVNGYAFTLQIGGLDTGLVVNITGDDTTGSAASDIDIAEGDIVRLKIAPIGLPAATPHAHWGLTWVPDVLGEGIVLGGTKDSAHTSNTEYTPVAGWSANLWGPGTITYADPSWEATIKKLYAAITTAPGGAKSWQFSLALNDVGTALLVTIAGAATSGNNTADEVAVADYDYISIESDPDLTPAANADVRWGFVLELAPLAPAGGGNLADMLVKNALI